MVGTLREEIDIPTYEADMRQKLEKSYRELDSLRFFRKNQLTVRFEYQDRDGELVTIIVLHP
jgi:nuclear transport factor 2 (NTF2) superfamily protein